LFVDAEVANGPFFFFLKAVILYIYENKTSNSYLAAAFLAATFFSLSALALATFSAVALAPFSTNPDNLPIQTYDTI
jgi:hypothetical protein